MRKKKYILGYPIIYFVIFLFLTSSCKKDDGVNINNINFNSSVTYGSVQDLDGNTYKTVIIGNQTWMAENLKTTKYNDGTSIPLVTDSATWKKLTTPGYCWYNYSEAGFKAAYGALYNWYAINTGKLCPTGWHVPTLNEWDTLITYLGDSLAKGKLLKSVSGGKLKETGNTHWISPNFDASNESGFTALSGGACFSSGIFFDAGNIGYWWSSTDGNPTTPNLAYVLDISYADASVDISAFYKKNGFSVRCIKDSE
jgi:uncharacterized protein (TIGR02145 family)